jgi:hypothetical protein
VEHNWDASKEYLVILEPAPGQNPPVKVSVIEDDYSGVATVHADSFALRVINAGSTTGAVYVTVAGTGTGFTAGPALVSGTPLAPRALQPDSFPAPFTLTAGEVSGFRTFRSATIPAIVADPNAVPPIVGVPAIPGQLRVRLFTDGTLISGTSAAAPRSNFLLATSAFTAAANRQTTLILTDRPTTGTITAILAPRCIKIA